MNVQRLTILRDALIEYAKNPGNLEFDLEYWGKVPREYENKPEAIDGAVRGENFCGTAACAMGLATTISTFRKLGLFLRPSFNAVQFRLVLESEGQCTATNWDVPQDFFDLSYEDAHELFSMERYSRRDCKSPLAVADKITALLETA